MANGGTVIGRCAPDNYDYRASLAQDGEQLLGLGLDYDNDEDECEGYMIMWLEDVMEELDYGPNGGLVYCIRIGARRVHWH